MSGLSATVMLPRRGVTLNSLPPALPLIMREGASVRQIKDSLALTPRNNYD